MSVEHALARRAIRLLVGLAALALRLIDRPLHQVCKCGKWVPYIEVSFIGPDRFDGGRR